MTSSCHLLLCPWQWNSRSHCLRSLLDGLRSDVARVSHIRWLSFGNVSICVDYFRSNWFWETDWKSKVGALMTTTLNWRFYLLLLRFLLLIGIGLIDLIRTYSINSIGTYLINSIETCSVDSIRTYSIISISVQLLHSLSSRLKPSVQTLGNRSGCFEFAASKLFHCACAKHK